MVRRTPVKGRAATHVLLALTFAAPLLVLGAAIAVRTGILSLEAGLDRISLQFGGALAWIGLAPAAGLVFLARRDPRRLALFAAAGVLVAVVTLGMFLWQKARLAAGPVEHVSTDLVEVPGFGDLRARRGGPGPGPAVGPQACPGAQPVMRQIAPEVGMWALQQAGFTVHGAGVGRADGYRSGYWFGVTHDAVIRIRPGRTDIRVAARDALPHGGEACRLASRISEALRTGS